MLGGPIETIRVTPDNPKTDIPVLLAFGWPEGSKVLKQAAAELFAAGRLVIVLDHTRH